MVIFHSHVSLPEGTSISTSKGLLVMRYPSKRVGTSVSIPSTPWLRWCAMWYLAIFDFQEVHNHWESMVIDSIMGLNHHKIGISLFIYYYIYIYIYIYCVHIHQLHCIRLRSLHYSTSHYVTLHDITYITCTTCITCITYSTGRHTYITDIHTYVIICRMYMHIFTC